MLASTVLKALRVHHHLRSTNTYIRSQNCGLGAFSFSPGADVQNVQSQNLKFLTDKWIHRLKRESVPEAELSVKFITEHFLGRERAGSSCSVYYWRMGIPPFDVGNETTCFHSKTRD